MTAATVVMTCSLKVRSESSRLFFAICICRWFTAMLNPCSKCWVTVRPSDELVAGLNREVALLPMAVELFNPRLTAFRSGSPAGRSPRMYPVAVLTRWCP